MSRYLILEQVVKNTHSTGEDLGELWQERGTVEATSGEGAVRAYINGAKSETGGGVFIAIPERSAKTVRVEVENVRKVSVKATDG